MNISEYICTVPTILAIIWPLLIYGLLTLLVIALMMFMSYILGQRHKEKATGEVYESGIEITGEARLRFPIHFYIIAMFFVIFDLEAVFIISWAVAFKELGWVGYWGIVIFIGMLLAALVYEWRIGAFDFGPKGKHIIKAYKKLKSPDL
jgi:NADH-quinone oxidoreductase subunit A